MYTIILIILQSLFIIIPVLILVAIFTLFERKVIGYTQRRKGPNKVGLLGFLQPFADGLKLMMKEPLIPTNSNFFLYIFAPILTLLLSLVSWILIPFGKGVVICDLNLGLLFILGISSLNVYGIILAGWSSNSTYSFLGALRSSAQMISYEVSLGLILITVLLAVGSFNLTEVVMFQESVWFFIPFFPLFVLFFISSIAETNRHPFDLPEAEAELVSGYNVEYASVGFAFFFIGEYANILLMSGLNVIIFFGGWLPIPFLSYIFIIPSYIWFFFKLMCFVFLYIMIRAMLPRFRYDQLMNLGWKVFLPLTLGFFVFYFGVLFGFGLNP